MSLDPPTTLPKNDLLGGSVPPPDSASRAFVLSFDLGGDRAKGGERGFVFLIGSFTFRRPGLRAVACHLGSTTRSTASFHFRYQDWSSKCVGIETKRIRYRAVPRWRRASTDAAIQRLPSLGDAASFDRSRTRCGGGTGATPSKRVTRHSGRRRLSRRLLGLVSSGRSPW